MQGHYATYAGTIANYSLPLVPTMSDLQVAMSSYAAKKDALIILHRNPVSMNILLHLESYLQNRRFFRQTKLPRYDTVLKRSSEAADIRPTGLHKYIVREKAEDFIKTSRCSLR